MDYETEHFGFLLLPGFPLAPFASAVDVLALANYVSERPLYSWCTIAQDAQPVVSMNGFAIAADHQLETTPRTSAITVCCGINGNRFDYCDLHHWLRQHHATGVRIGSMSTGSWILAQAGLLNNKRCTIHWEDLGAFQESYPLLRATRDIYQLDGRIFTCSGGSAATDMFLSFVAAQHGISLAVAVAEQLVHGQARDKDTNQQLDLPSRIGITNRSLVGAIQLMEQHIDQPLSQKNIAEKLGISPRHLERLFRNKLGQTPQFYYRELRLRHARSLLRATTMSVSEIAFASGFSSSSYFSKCFNELFGNLPNMERVKNNP